MELAITRGQTDEIDAVDLDYGSLDVARVDGKVTGVALWLPPKDTSASLASRVKSRARRVLRIAPHVPSLVGALPPASHLPRLISATRTIAAAVPNVPHWHLMDIAVDADCRGQNIGERLLEHGLERVDTDDAPAYLEASTPRAAELYARHGFGTIQVMQIGQAPVHAMLRPV